MTWASQQKGCHSWGAVEICSDKYQRDAQQFAVKSLALEARSGAILAPFKPKQKTLKTFKKKWHALA